MKVFDIHKRIFDFVLNALKQIKYVPQTEENKIIIKDPERFNLIRKMWDLMLTGSYTPPKILELMIF